MRKKTAPKSQPQSISPERKAERSAASEAETPGSLSSRQQPRRDDAVRERDLALLFRQPKRLPLPTIFFASPEHRTRLLTIMQQIGKVYDGKLDFEYLAALYLLTADESSWKYVRPYISRDGIRFTEMLHELYWSSSERLLAEVAYNLFSGNPEAKVDLSGMTNLDQRNVQLAVCAIQLYWFAHAYGVKAEELAAPEGGDA